MPVPLALSCVLAPTSGVFGGGNEEWRDWRSELARRQGPSVSMVTPLVAILMLSLSANALAHGERAQEPSLRLSTIQWYDTKWSRDQIGVNEELTVSGRFHVM